MNEEELFNLRAEEQGWTPETQVYVLLEYIANQQSPEAFSDFIGQQCEEECNGGGYE